ncbi:MAG TPA: AAA family ATPase [Trueperaceae bacterium]|nr:AAA family ATPase [Trueperaceae bacterium]
MTREAPQANLFEASTREPLAARMRPRTLDEFIGQDRIIGPGRLLRRAIQADQLSSVIFYGPPGTGKTTLARVIANSTKARFIAINAVLAGVKDIREAVAEAQAQRRAGQRTILFVDEVHRFNKAQQDALLPWVESGVLTLIGATTENPYFEVNKALVSRSRIFELEPLDEGDLRAVVAQALADTERGYGQLRVDLQQDALDHLVNVANGDARALLNALELAVDTTEPDSDGHIVITREVAEESIQRRAVLYDKEGDAHFDTISAFIKSVRGSDPDAALYWLAKMVYAGEDPRYVFRRLLILAGEDVGIADPQALMVVTAAAQAFDYVGLPEGRFHLAQATLYLATAPKSNSTLGFFDALAAVQNEREVEVPDHLKDANRDAEGLGHGEGYAYPHAFRDHWVAQQYLPEALQGKLFYQPSDVGHEATVGVEVQRRREAQLAAMLEATDQAPKATRSAAGRPLMERSADKWLERTVSRTGERLAAIRDQIFTFAAVDRHSTVLDLKAGTGLLTWEALRRAPEGQVWALTAEEDNASTLRQMAANLPELQRPQVAVAYPQDALSAVALDRFDAIVGRNVVSDLLSSAIEGVEAAASDAALTTYFSSLGSLLARSGILVLAEPDARMAQRLYRLVELDNESLLAALMAAEEGIYAALATPTPETVSAAARAAGLHEVRIKSRSFMSREWLTRATVAGWFETNAAAPTYADHLRSSLTGEQVDTVRSAFLRQVADSESAWTVTYYFLIAQAAAPSSEPTV